MEALCKEAGADELLKKPFGIAELEQMIEKVKS
jgi:DNA-binding response OmpR family regulator